MASVAREAWTDERLDDLNTKVDRLDQRVESGFAEMRGEIRAGRAEMREGLAIGRAALDENRAEVGEKFDRIDTDMREIRVELGALNRTIHQFMFAIVGTVFLGFMGTISGLATLT